MSEPQAFIDDQRVVFKTVQQTRHELRPVFRFLPRFLLVILERIGIPTTRLLLVQINMLEDIPPAGEAVVIVYSVDYDDEPGEIV